MSHSDVERYLDIAIGKMARRLADQAGIDAPSELHMLAMTISQLNYMRALSFRPGRTPGATEDGATEDG